MTHEHLSDEQLSAHLDGVPFEVAATSAALDESSEAQIVACDTCRRRLAALGEASALVRLPVVPVPPAVREAAVDTAIASVLAVETGAGPVPTGARRSSRPSRPGRPSRVFAAAAAVVVLGLAVGVPLGLSHGSRGTSSASEASHAPVSRAAPVPGAPAARGGGVANLGTVTSLRTLRARLGPVLASGGNGQGFDSASGLAAAGAQSKTGDQAAAAPVTVGSVPAQYATCVAVAQRAAGAADTVVLVATATYGHTPALVIVAQDARTTPPAAPGRLAVVVARSGCRVLARTTP